MPWLLKVLPSPQPSPFSPHPSVLELDGRGTVAHRRREHHPKSKEGDDILGTLTLRTSDDFDAGMQVQVAFFSLGPSFSDRDDYTVADLNMGVVINGG